MNALEQLLAMPRYKSLFMAHLIAGYPSVAQSEKVARALAQGGADILEVQIPFSDPMADGPTIAVACEEALAHGATVAKALGVIQSAVAFGKPVAVMSYLNPIYRYGIPKFVKTIAKCGASGLIVPDCPFDTDEGRALLAACKEYDVCLIPVISPGVPHERLAQLAKDARGFVYCTSRQGITGANSRFARTLFNFVKEARSMFNLPIAVGFGVKTRADVRTLEKEADVVVAGSVFVGALKKNKKVSDVAQAIRKIVS